MDQRFAAFLRLQVGKQWYRVSDHVNWHFKLDAVYHNGQWTNHGSDFGLSAPTD